jgi:V/A-type H+-transporting ATPase subunit D
MAQQAAPTKGNLIAAKRSRELAENGFELMDKKRNILVRELMALLDQASDIQGRIDEAFSEAYESLRMANISLGGSEHIAAAIPVDDSVSVIFRSVMGVELPILNSEPTGGEIPYGFTDTTSALDNAYVNFNRVKHLSLELAETENSIYRLAYFIKKTRKRANALQNIVIPGLDADISRITEELEEKEREEFVRMKVIKSRKE